MHALMRLLPDAIRCRLRLAQARSQPIHVRTRLEPVRPRSVGRFTGWKDLVLTPAVEVGILAMSIALTVAFDRTVALAYSMSWPERIMTLYVLQLVVSVLVIRSILALFPLREGIHGTRTAARYIFNLTGFIMNLNAYGVLGTLVPPFLRHLVCRALGARIGKGIVIVSGKIADPSLTEIGADVIIGEGALILAHAIGVASESDDYVLLARVSIGEGAIVGAHSVVLPGVTIGKHAMVQPLSLVPSHTKIPPGEIWAGIPAKKVGAVRRTRSTSVAAERRPCPGAERAA